MKIAIGPRPLSIMRLSGKYFETNPVVTVPPCGICFDNSLVLNRRTGLERCAGKDAVIEIAQSRIFNRV